MIFLKVLLQFKWAEVMLIFFGFSFDYYYILKK